MKYLSGITLLLIIFSSHAMACENMKKNKSASVLNLESTETTQAEATSAPEKNLIAEESSFDQNIDRTVGESKK